MCFLKWIFYYKCTIVGNARATIGTGTKLIPIPPGATLLLPLKTGNN